jgi:hypothetical protein
MIFETGLVVLLSFRRRPHFFFLLQEKPPDEVLCESTSPGPPEPDVFCELGFSEPAELKERMAGKVKMIGGI